MYSYFSRGCIKMQDWERFLGGTDVFARLRITNLSGCSSR
jgi:hypothetical protein